MKDPDLLIPEVPDRTDLELADFLLSFIQAFLKTGYYRSEHPEARKAREGLYASLTTVLKGRKEISFLSMGEAGRHDVFLAGISDEPVSIGRLFQKNMAELFVPKFAEYFERKNLSSFSLKSEISEAEFGKFIEIMTGSPLAGEKDAEGREQLSMDLIRNEVLMVSTVFNVDLVGRGRKLPWRVEIALSRLRKDLNMIPLYRNLTPEKAAELRKMIFEDIIRPLNNARLIKEILVNLDLVSHDLTGITAEEFEQRIIENFSERLMIEVAHEVLRDFADLRAAFAKVQEVELLVRLDYLKNILRKLSMRLKESATFDDDLFLNLLKQGILQAEDMPDEIRSRTEAKLAMETFLVEPEPFFSEIEQATDRAELEAGIRRLFGFLPTLIAEGRMNEVLRIFRVAAAKEIFYEQSEDTELSDAVSSAIIGRIEQAGKEEQMRILSLLQSIGMAGTSILAGLLDSRSRFVRRSALDHLVKSGGPAAQLIADVIPKKQGWHFLRNALIVFSKTGISRPDIADIFRQALQHKEPNVRKEAIQGAALILGPEAEAGLLELLKDKNDELRIKALAALASIKSTAKAFQDQLAGSLSLGDDYNEQAMDTALKAIIEGGFSQGRVPALEDRILDLLKETALPGFLSKRKSISPATKELALKALGVIGTAAALKLLKRYSSDKIPALGRAAAESCRQILSVQRL